MEKIRNLLFVCTGNICRSPMAEAVFRTRARQRGLSEQLTFDSAGTHAYHVGEQPDIRTLRMCYENGIGADGLVARKISGADFGAFDVILGMDRGHVENLRAAAPREAQDKIHMFMDYAGLGRLDVPDPYYGDMEDFMHVYEMVSHAATAILDRLELVHRTEEGYDDRQKGA